MDPKRTASSWAARSPTMRMPRPLRRRESPRVFDAWMARLQVGGGLLGQPLEVRELIDRQVIEIGEVAHPLLVDQLGDHALAEVLDVHVTRRDPKWKSRSLSWAGQALLVQRQTDSPSARTAAPPQAGQ